jgi:hypothetical protein
LPWKLPWAIPLFPRGLSTIGWRGVYPPILKTFSSPDALNVQCAWKVLGASDVIRFLTVWAQRVLKTAAEAPLKNFPRWIFCLLLWPRKKVGHISRLPDHSRVVKLAAVKWKSALTPSPVWIFNF